MPSGHPKDPVAYREKMLASRQAREARKLEQKQSDEALAALRAKLTGESSDQQFVLPEKYAREIESLEAQLKTERRISDDLQKKVERVETRLSTVLDLVCQLGITTT